MRPSLTRRKKSKSRQTNRPDEFPAIKMMIDSFGRVATDLRLSVTDRCNLRCTYCMSEDGMKFAARDELLAVHELVSLVKVFASLGVTSVRLTGGEPLVRKDILEIVEQCHALGIDDLSLTTNATRLAKFAGALKTAGLKRVNISIDSLQRKRFASITRRDMLPDVLDGLHAAIAAGLRPVKINCVLIRNVNDDELIAFAELARTTGCDVRFIEPMPLDADRSWTQDQVVPASEIVETISATYQLAPIVERGHAPASSYTFSDGAQGSIGVIGSVTEPFCKRCDRLRLTADGKLRTCLFADDETDLAAPLRSGASEAQLSALIESAVFDKQEGHEIGNVSFKPPHRTMSAIGG